LLTVVELDVCGILRLDPKNETFEGLTIASGSSVVVDDVVDDDDDVESSVTGSAGMIRSDPRTINKSPVLNEREEDE
jgi:hypothetical protein